MAPPQSETRQKARAVTLAASLRLGEWPGMLTVAIVTATEAASVPIATMPARSHGSAIDFLTRSSCVIDRAVEWENIGV